MKYGKHKLYECKTYENIFRLLPLHSAVDQVCITLLDPNLFSLMYNSLCTISKAVLNDIQRRPKSVYLYMRQSVHLSHALLKNKKVLCTRSSYYTNKYSYQSQNIFLEKRTTGSVFLLYSDWKIFVGSLFRPKRLAFFTVDRSALVCLFYFTVWQ